MNEMNVMSTRTTGRVQAIDEIAFHTSILALQAAVEAGGEACPVAGWSARAASHTLALIEQSLNYSPQTEPGDSEEPVAIGRIGESVPRGRKESSSADGEADPGHERRPAVRRTEVMCVPTS